MPNLDGTGPVTRTGRGKGNCCRGQGGSKECTCPKCDHKEFQLRGIPCSEKDCPKCGTPMKGSFCS